MELIILPFKENMTWKDSNEVVKIGGFIDWSSQTPRTN